MEMTTSVDYELTTFHLYAEQFLWELSNIQLEDDDLSMFFHVTRLFTSIDSRPAMDVTGVLVEREAHRMANISKANLYKVLSLFLNTNFEFDDKIYQQIRCIPIRSSISGFIAGVECRN